MVNVTVYMTFYFLLYIKSRNEIRFALKYPFSKTHIKGRKYINEMCDSNYDDHKIL